MVVIRGALYVKYEIFGRKIKFFNKFIGEEIGVYSSIGVLKQGNHGIISLVEKLRRWLSLRGGGAYESKHQNL
ncbi:hypothetical protein GU333_08180 [Lactococcus raffinolactis]|uniref:hypothetical protein n=1 Tax=Pseudolactococcus raffinolactis TaxID=1366 RepID=UPI001436B2A1|nr:hypothetical protein [Lactococcus raffinolactis]QIW61096.1 hypothetical protein GU333_08180 [Lactococcus raffinolactis]